MVHSIVVVRAIEEKEWQSMGTISIMEKEIGTYDITKKDNKFWNYYISLFLLWRIGKTIQILADHPPLLFPPPTPSRPHFFLIQQYPHFSFLLPWAEKREVRKGTKWSRLNLMWLYCRQSSECGLFTDFYLDRSVTVNRFSCWSSTTVRWEHNRSWTDEK